MKRTDGRYMSARSATKNPSSCFGKLNSPKQSMKPTGPPRNAFSVFATIPCCDLFLSSQVHATLDDICEDQMMNLGDLANLGQIIGALAVVISLFYVAHQIRQNTNAVRSATAQSVHEHFANWYRLVAADAELSRIVVNGLKDY